MSPNSPELKLRDWESLKISSVPHHDTDAQGTYTANLCQLSSGDSLTRSNKTYPAVTWALWIGSTDRLQQRPDHKFCLYLRYELENNPLIKCTAPALFSLTTFTPNPSQRGLELWLLPPQFTNDPRTVFVSCHILLQREVLLMTRLTCSVSSASGDPERLSNM